MPVTGDEEIDLLEEFPCIVDHLTNAPFFHDGFQYFESKGKKQLEKFVLCICYAFVLGGICGAGRAHENKGD